MRSKNLPNSRLCRLVGVTLAATLLLAAPAAIVAQDAESDTAGAVAHAKALSRAFRHAAEKTMPTVVKIRTHTNPRVRSDRGERDPGENPFRGTPFEDLFDERMEDMFDLPFTPRDGVGSGVIIDASGTILTNNHVVEGADELTVVLSDGREFKATGAKTDPQTDLAVIEIEGAGTLPAAKLGNSDELEIGDWVIAVGNPFELEQTVSAGIISGKGRELGSVERAKFLQTDAAINPGNSGGPLVNLDGEVVGINTAIASNNGGYQGIGFAIPANTAKWVVGQLIERGSVQRAYLGVNIGATESELAEQLGVERDGGVLVADVFPNTPAAEAGIETGDVITRFAGIEVRKPRELQEAVERMPLGSKQEVVVLREGKPVRLQVVMREMPGEFGRTAELSPGRRGAPSNGSTFDSDELGIQVSELTSEQARALGYEGYEGVLITEVARGSVAAERGLQPGMLIRRVGRSDVASLADFEAAVKDASLADGVLLLIRTPQGSQTFIVLKE